VFVYCSGTLCLYISVVILTRLYGTEPRNRGSTPETCSICCFSPQHPVGLRSQTFSMCTGGLFPQGQSGRIVNLTIHLHLAPRLRISEALLPLPHMPSLRGILIYHKDKWNLTPKHKISANFAVSVRFKIYGPIPFEKLNVKVTVSVM
jgi:hypothetical protein